MFKSPLNEEIDRLFGTLDHPPIDGEIVEDEKTKSENYLRRKYPGLFLPKKDSI